jgi:hypothetical protein
MPRDGLRRHTPYLLALLASVLLVPITAQVRPVHAVGIGRLVIVVDRRDLGALHGLAGRVEDVAVDPRATGVNGHRTGHRGSDPRTGARQDTRSKARAE